MSHKLGICIPYRNRKEHIENLIPYLSKYLNEKGINHAFYVGHQIDDRLFNRGAMKNIAAHYAFEDGCDYIAWHDVDMLALDKDGLICDYSYPDKSPIHIATRLSKYNYGLGYDQYFGGVVLFTKEQAYQTNGYSNDYWDWGQEDDDLFFRCHFEGYSNSNIFSEQKENVLNFNGVSSLAVIPTNKKTSKSLTGNHTIQILFKAEQQEEKVPIWLVGDENRKFIEYPILRKHESWTWGISFNNSRTVNMTIFDKNNQYHNNWAKKSEGEWTWVTASFNKKTKELYFFINNELVTNMNGIKENIPFTIGENLKSHDDTNPFVLGFCSNQKIYFKGQIAKFRILNKFFDTSESAFKNTKDVLLEMVLENNQIYDSINNIICEHLDVEMTNENINVVENIIPIRREGNFECMFHKDEGFVDGKWAKGETTARNEKRFVTEMQQRKINYKEDGLNKILDVLEIDNIDTKLYTNTTFINVRMK